MSSNKHLLLDFGGVCLLTPFELHRRVERKLGLAEGALTWRGPFDPSSDPLWQQLLAKEITEREYWQRQSSALGRQSGHGDRWTTRDYMNLAYLDEPEDVIIRPAARQLVLDAKAAGRKAGILTNDLYDFHGAEWVHSISFFQMFDALTDASRIPALKPDPRAYQAAVDDLGVRKDEIVFVDDQTRNVEGARAFGITTVYFDVANAHAGWEEARHLLALPTP